MQETFFAFTSKIFFEIAQKKPEEFGFFISNKIDFPILTLDKKFEAIIPLPRKKGESYLFEGIVFKDSKESRHNLWSLFLASIYHLASHAAVSNYSIYEEWRKNKSEDICWKIIDFIEDAVADQYLFTTAPEILNAVERIKSTFSSNHKASNNDVRQNAKISFMDFVLHSKQEKIISIREEIVKKRGSSDYVKNMLSYADMLYKNRMLIPDYVLPYSEHHHVKNTSDVIIAGTDFKPKPSFQHINELDELWKKEELDMTKMIVRYKKHFADLHFDEIVLPPRDMSEYLRIRANNSLLIKKIRDQITSVSNLVDNPKIQEMGLINMQYAIQAIASESQNIEIFEQDEARRHDESWVILVDNSSSMKAKFDQIKELVTCVSESADVLTGVGGEWALYSFDNNFSIIKDSKEKYTEDVKARIGGLKSGGLSFVSDGIKLASRMLQEDSAERKYIFIFTDGQSSGYEKIDKDLREAIKMAEKYGISVIGIGLSPSISKYFKMSCSGTDLRELVSKFVSSYRTAALQQM